MLPEIIASAQRHLTESPFDTLHAVSHHQQVWDNCNWIVEQEGLNPDMEVLEVAAWWHDVERGSDGFTLMQETLRQLGAKEEFIGKVLGAVGSHSFGQNQETLEGKILYDADKLEYLSVDRLKALLALREQKGMGKKRFNYYKEAWAERINGVRGSFHFDSASKKFEKDLKKFLKFARKDPRLRSFTLAVI